MQKVMFFELWKTKAKMALNKKALIFSAFAMSGQKDLNLRPPAPKA